jgi:glyoxylase-like metal-dependent hydrolase (beta-lactamase superfamily II)
VLKADGVRLEALYTPGHTDDSYSFAMGDRVFSGDAPLIRSTGQTDFQNGERSVVVKSLRPGGFKKLTEKVGYSFGASPPGGKRHKQ